MTQRTALALLLLLGAALAGPVEYTFIPLPRLHPDRSGLAVTVNDHRQVSGWAQTPDVPADRALIWSIAPDSSVTVADIGLFEGRRMFGRGMNNHGQMTGYSWVNGDGEFGFRHDGTTLVQLDNPFEAPPDGGTFHTITLRINDDGWICGHASAGTSNAGPYTAAVWDPAGDVHVLGTLGGARSFADNLSRTFVCGRSEIAPGSSSIRAYRWDFETATMEMLDLLPGHGHVHSNARAVNNHGDVAGVSSTQPFGFAPETLGVVWYADGSVRQLDAIGTPDVDDIFASAQSINDAGWVVGFSSLGAFSAQMRHPVLWLPDETRIDLLSLLPVGALNVTTTTISSTGWICGTYVDSATNVGQPYVLRPTPATQIGMLMDQVDRLDLGRIGRGLNLQLKVALAKVEDGKPHIAVKLLAVFAFEMKLLERFRKLDNIETDSLLAVVDDAAAALKGE